jgi:lauroyl/myristoyl acyltransferase
LNAALGSLERFLTPLGLLAIRILPRRVSYVLAESVMGVVAARRRSPLFRAVQANQSIVRRLTPGDPRLDRAIREVFLEAGRGYVDWFRALALGPRALSGIVRISPVLQDVLRGRGAVIVGGHVNGFNLAVLRFSLEPASLLLLTMPDVSGPHGLENVLRGRFGLSTAPMSVAALRRGLRLLQAGGKVLTGVDRPDPDGRPLMFFGRRARLPLGHVRMAARVGVPLFVADIRRDGPGKYAIDGTFMDQPRTKDPSEAVLVSAAEEVLRRLEQCIRRRPSSWLMFLPVWQDRDP